jgi:CheY-like chemotaxis protein
MWGDDSGFPLTISQPPPSLSAARSRARIISRPRLLVVDDEPVIGSVLRRIFRGSHEVTAVEHGREALSILDAGADFDVVLCDLVMPDLSGPEVYEEVRRRHPRLLDRFVFMTGGALGDKTRAFLAAVRNPIITKPFELGPLRDLVNGLVAAAS